MPSGRFPMAVPGREMRSPAHGKRWTVFGPIRVARKEQLNEVGESDGSQDKVSVVPGAAKPLVRGDYAERWRHHDIGLLIRATKNLIVYIDPVGALDWETTTEYDESAPDRPDENLSKRQSILGDCAVLETRPCQGLAPEAVRQYKRLLGEAIAAALNREYSTGQKMVVAARQYVQDRSNETSRKWYLSASFNASVPVGLAGLVLWLARTPAITLLGSTGFWILLAGFAGGLGALFSIITRSGRLNFDCSAGKELHELGVCRK